MTWGRERGIITKNITWTLIFFSSRNPKGSYSFGVHSPFERGRRTKRGRRFSETDRRHRERLGSLQHRWPRAELWGQLVSVSIITHLIRPLLPYLSGSHPMFCTWNRYSIHICQQNGLHSVRLEMTKWFSAGHMVFIQIKESSGTRMTRTFGITVPRGGLTAKWMKLKIQGPSFA